MNTRCVSRPSPIPAPLLILGVLLLAGGPAMQAAPDPATCPLHAEHMAAKAAPPPVTSSPHHDEVDRRGDATMGFDHLKTRHTFELTDQGGAIRVRALAGDDAESLAAIRRHLALLPEAFSRGDFSMPSEIHGVLPPGASEMSRLRDRIRYSYAERPDGGEVRITSADSEARSAIHAFLKFQIEDHRTGDSAAVEKDQ